MKIKTKLLSLSSSVLLLALSAPAHATFSWTFNSSPTNQGSPSGTAITATASAWATSTNNTSSGLEAANLRQYSGLGVEPVGQNEGSPQHAIDAQGRKESVLFSFSQSIALTKVHMSWVGGKYLGNGNYASDDADFSLLRYTGSGGPSLAGNSYADLLTSGWELVSRANYYQSNYTTSGLSLNSNGSGDTANVNLGMLSSSYWLVAAANTSLGWTSGYTGNDYFKLNKVYGKTVTPPTGVPTAGTLPLIALSLLGLTFVNRRKKA